MKYTLLFTLVFIFFNSALCQLSGVVVDEKKQALPFANIGIMDSSEGTVSDEKGHFILNSSKTSLSLRVSSVGYEVKNLIWSENDTIILKTRDYQMPIVEIKAKSFDKDVVRLGMMNKTRGKSIGFGRHQLGISLGAAIEIKKETWIKSANFVINHAKGDSMLFRVNLHYYRDGEIGESLLPENVFIKDAQRKGKISVDLRHFNILANGDVMLSLEWLKDFKGSGTEGLSFDTKKGKKYKGVWSKMSNTSPWTKVGPMGKSTLCFFLEGSQKKN